MMPEPPPVNLFIKYVLENPWPAGLALLLIGVSLLWMGLREGLSSRLKAGAGFAAAGAIILTLGMTITTAGEQAKKVARQLSDAAVAGDAVAAMALFSPDAVFTFVSPKNPGRNYDFIQSEIVGLLDRYEIETNTISMLRGYTESSDAATVHMACVTKISQWTNLSQWVLRVERASDGSWRITKLTCVSINGNPPPSDGIR